MSEPVTDTSPSPSNCGMSAINCGLLGSWCCRLRLASGTGADRLVVTSASSPTAPAVSFLDAAAFAIAAALVFAAAVGRLSAVAVTVAAVKAAAVAATGLFRISCIDVVILKYSTYFQLRPSLVN
jgi:hypothetical protein